jgi:hypothetical protein
MSWYYACKKVKAEFGDGHEYTVVEVFPGLKIDTNDVVPHTEETTFFGETPEDLAKWLRIAAEDIEKHGCINEKTRSVVGDKDHWVNRMDEDE